MLCTHRLTIPVSAGGSLARGRVRPPRGPKTHGVRLGALFVVAAPREAHGRPRREHRRHPVHRFRMRSYQHPDTAKAAGRAGDVHKPPARQRTLSSKRCQRPAELCPRAPPRAATGWRRRRSALQQRRCHGTFRVTLLRHGYMPTCTARGGNLVGKGGLDEEEKMCVCACVCVRMRKREREGGGGERGGGGEGGRGRAGE